MALPTSSSGLGPIARQEVAERRLAVLAHGLVQAGQVARELTRLDHLVLGKLRPLSDLLVRGIATQLRRELLLDAPHLALALSDVHRHADGPPGVLEAALDRLPNPERAVGGELEAPTPVELLDGADQSEHALLDQVPHREALPLVPTRLRDHEPQVRVHHAVLRLHVAALDPLRELDLLTGREQGVLARLPEEDAERVERGVGSLLDAAVTVVPRIAIGGVHVATPPLTPGAGIGGLAARPPGPEGV